MWQAIYKREVSSVLNNRWSPALFLPPLLLLGGLVVVRWPSAGQVDVAGTRSRELFSLIGLSALGCVLTLTPAFPAASIVRERRQGTLALLFRTPVSGAGIYLGKFLGALTCTLLPLAMVLPAVAACYAMGGIDLQEDVLPLYAMLLLTIVEFTAASLWVSRFASTTSAAIRGAYGLVVALTVLPMGPSLLVPPGASGPLASTAEWLRCVSPIAPALELLGRSAAGLQPSDGPSPMIRFALSAILLAAIFSIHAAWSLTPAMFDRSRAPETMTQDRSAAAKTFRRIMFLVDPQRRRGATQDWINPVLVKELRSRRFGRGHWMARLVAACAIASLALAYIATTGAIAWSPESVGGFMVLLQTALLVLFTPSLASGIISEEREIGGWTLLCMTPLTIGQIVRGKLLSVAWTMSLILLATLPGYAVMVLVKPALLQQVRSVLVTLTLIGVFAVCLSGAVSAFYRRTTAATLAAYLILIILLGGPLVVWLGRDAPFGRQTVERALSFSPVAAALSLIEAPGFTSYQLLPSAWRTLGVGIAASLAILCWKTLQLARPQ